MSMLEIPSSVVAVVAFGLTWVYAAACWALGHKLVAKLFG